MRFKKIFRVGSVWVIFAALFSFLSGGDVGAQGNPLEINYSTSINGVWGISKSVSIGRMPAV
jgi:hypothetical protein